MCFQQFAATKDLEKFVADFWALDKRDQDSLVLQIIFHFFCFGFGKLMDVYIYIYIIYIYMDVYGIRWAFPRYIYIYIIYIYIIYIHIYIYILYIYGKLNPMTQIRIQHVDWVHAPHWFRSPHAKSKQTSYNFLQHSSNGTNLIGFHTP